MDSNYKLRLRVGQHEFDAEGPADVVNAQFQAFMQAVSSLPAPLVAPAPIVVAPAITDRKPDDVDPGPPPPSPRPSEAVDGSLEKIMRVENRVISLTVRPRNIDDAVLLLLYGQKALRNNDSVTGGELISGLTTTGGLSVVRVDRLLEKAARDGDAIVIGERRSKTYRLTNAGLTKARQLAADLIAIVA